MKCQILFSRKNKINILKKSSANFVPACKGLIVTDELNRLEHLWSHGYLFYTWVLRATEG